MTSFTETPRETFRAWLAGNWKNLLIVLAIGLLPFLPILFSGQILFASDQMGSPVWRWYFEGLHRGEIALWTPYALGGMPTLDANAGSGLYLPFLIIGFLFPITRFMTVDLILHVMIAGFTAYLLVQRYFNLQKWLATALAVAYMLNTNFISLIYGGHDGKVHIIAFLPLALYFLLRSLTPGTKWRHLVGLAFCVGLFVSTSHLQFTYFVLMGFFFVWLFHLVPALRARRFAESLSLVFRYWGPVFLGLGLMFFMLSPPKKYNDEFSIRGAGARTTFEHSTSWSMHPEETASLLVPEFGGLNENYWGRNYFKLNSEYPGILVWFLGLLGLFAFRGRWFWLWGTIGGLAIIYGLGAHTPLFRLFYEYVPMVKVFRAPSMMLFWLTAALLMMSGETLRRLARVGDGALPDAARARIAKRLRVAGFAVAGVLAVFGLVPSLPVSIWNGLTDLSQIPNIARQSMGQSSFALGALRAAVLVAVLTWAALAFLLKSRRPAAFGLAALAVTVVDLYWVDSNFIQGVPTERLLSYDPVVDFLKSDKQRHRVFGLPGVFGSLNAPYYGIEAVDGRADHELRHYRHYRGDDYDNNPNFMQGLRQDSLGNVSGSIHLDLLNVKYIAFHVPNDPGVKLVQNVSALPRAWFVPSWKAATDSQAYDGLRDPAFDPRRMAYVTGPSLVSGGDPGAPGAPLLEAAEKVRRYNRQVYTVTAPSEGLLVLSEIWFPHWRARVDGVETPLLRTNFAFRGVMLKPGAHEVEMYYSSPWLRKGLMVSGASLAVLILLLALGAFSRPGSRLSRVPGA